MNANPTTVTDSEKAAMTRVQVKEMFSRLAQIETAKTNTIAGLKQRIEQPQVIEAFGQDYSAIKAQVDAL